MCFTDKINSCFIILASFLFIGCTGDSEMDGLAKELALVNCDVTHYAEKLTEVEFGSEEYNRLTDDLEILRKDRVALLNKITEKYNTDEVFDQFYQVYQQKHKEYCQNR